MTVGPGPIIPRECDSSNGINFGDPDHVVKLLDSLLDAIVRLEGDALVMHVGEKPYVITASASMNAYRGPLAWGQVELSSRVLTFDAVSSMLAQILPADQQRALDEFGAIEHEILPPNGVLDRFTVIAARGGEDVWVEVRRKPVVPAVPDVPVEAEAEAEAEQEQEPVAVAAPVEEPAATEPAATEPAHVEPTPAPEPVAAPELEPVAERLEEPPAPVQEELDSIVVALPGQDSEEVQLDGVADNAIQIIDDEPQGVPTEEEVDAMLAATASALLTSSLPVEEAVDDEIVHVENDAAAPVEPEAALPVETEVTLPVETPADPPFELSAPTEVVPEAIEPEPEPVPAGLPEGTPLFTEAAEAAAAAVPEPQPEPAPEPEPTPEPVTVAPPPIAIVAEATEEDATITVSDEPEVADIDPGVGSIEITPDAVVAAASHLEPPVQIPEFVSPLNADVAPAAAESVPLAAYPTAPEMTMDPTPESRYVEPTSQLNTPSPLSAAAAGGPPTGDGGGAGAPVVTDTVGDADGRQGSVVPMARPPIKPEVVTTPFTPSEDAALMHTLRAAAARGAGTVYVVAQSKPMIRVDGEITALESEPMLTASDVERLVLELAPPRKREAFQSGPVEWLCDVPEIGRVRCLTFRDHRGPGVLFRMFPPRAISADQLGLTPEVQALCQQPDGLVLVTGARSSGKSTLLNAFVDLINRTRSDHVITVETQIGFVHESRRSFISQRETRGDSEFAASVARAALREDPDVMMIEELKSADLVASALEAAESGRLVLASVPAASTIAALERAIELFPADRRPKVRASLATSLRGVIAQVLLRRQTGGRVAAREILLNTPAVSTLVLEGKMFQLPVALDGGRRLGMLPLTDSLAGFVRDGTVHPGEAYRKALDRAALVAALKRDGFDTSFAERLA
jgi:twitching motility protein PilT